MIATVRASFDPVFPNKILKIQDSIGLIANMERKYGATTMLQSLYALLTGSTCSCQQRKFFSWCSFEMEWSRSPEKRRWRRRRIHQGSMAWQCIRFKILRESSEIILNFIEWQSYKDLLQELYLYQPNWTETNWLDQQANGLFGLRVGDVNKDDGINGFSG